MDALINLLAEHGVLGIILGLSIWGGTKLLMYTKDLIEKNDARLENIIKSHEDERKVFMIKVEEMSTRHDDALLGLTNVIKEIQITLEKINK